MPLDQFKSVSPSDGDDAYVTALSDLGAYMAERLPSDLKEEALVPFHETPKKDLLVGNFTRKAGIKKDVLHFDCKKLSSLSCCLHRKILCTERGNKSTPRYNNIWWLETLLEFDEFKKRKPSKQELKIVLTKFDRDLKVGRFSMEGLRLARVTVMNHCIEKRKYSKTNCPIPCVHELCRTWRSAAVPPTSGRTTLRSPPLRSKRFGLPVVGDGGTPRLLPMSGCKRAKICLCTGQRLTLSLSSFIFQALTPGLTRRQVPVGKGVNLRPVQNMMSLSQNLRTAHSHKRH